MKAKIKVGFGARIQAVSYHPIESNDSIEIEIEVANEEELVRQYEHYQKLIQEKVIKNVISGAKAFTEQRSEFLASLKQFLNEDE